jgi:hypothetical protein
MSVKRCSIAILGLLALLSSAAGSTTELTEASVRALIAKVDRAIPARNVAVIAEVLAERVVISVNMTVNGQLQHLSPDRGQYLDMLKQTWATVSDYRYRRYNQRITIEGHQAIVTADVWESATLNGQTMSTQSRETTIIESVDGKLQATAISTTGHD